MKNEKNCGYVAFSNLISKKLYKLLCKAFFITKTSESWRGRRIPTILIYKEEKEALNAMIFMVLLIEREAAGETVDWDACIAYMVKRIIRKAFTWDAKPENKDELCKQRKGYAKLEKKYVKGKIEDGVSKEFADALEFVATRISPAEELLYSVAKHLANCIEYSQIESTVYPSNKAKIEEQLEEKADKYNINKYCTVKLYKLFTYFSLCRNIVRWQGCGFPVNCNILCHMYETAIWAYFAAIELNTLEGYEKFVPHEMFKKALFHDLSEFWTDDVPSNCKNDIGKSEPDGTIRPATEELEKKALEEFFYPLLPESIRDIFKAKIMFEEETDEDIHTFIKNMDYFSADCECYWAIVGGTRNKKAINVIANSLSEEKKRTPAMREFLAEIYENIKGIVFLEP